MNDPSASTLDVRTQWSRMVAGQLYDASDPDLVRRRVRARRLFSRYNATDPADNDSRAVLLRELLGKCGTGAWIEPPFYCDYGENIELGDNSYLNFGCVMLDCARISLGQNVMVGPFAQFLSAHHPLEARERCKGPELASPIIIGDRVWIGGGVIICPGVTIESDTTIGAGSVVTRNIPAAVLAVGNPCRVMKTLA